MLARIWGSTGSISSPGAAHVRYGGNTSCLQVETSSGEQVILDGGSGIRGLGAELTGAPVHVVLTHLHIDHVQGLGFFRPLFSSGCELHLWGPGGDSSFREQLDQYFSPPLFPVSLDSVACDLHVHDLPTGRFHIPGFVVETAQVAHPGPTVGVRVEADGRSLVYLPDHEPGHRHGEPDGDEAARSLCSNSDLLFHDAMYLDRDYEATQGFGHSSVSVACEFLEGVPGLTAVVPFHQEPGYDDDLRDDVVAAMGRRLSALTVAPPLEGSTLSL